MTWVYNIKNYLRLTILFFIFSTTYYFLEILYDGGSHWTMFVCGGLSGIFGHLLYQNNPEMTVLRRCIAITLMILALEYISGYIVNIRMGLNIWDYSNLPLNLDGQICLRFALLWFFLFSPLILWISAELSYLVFGEQKPPVLKFFYQQLMLDMLNLPNKVRFKTLRS